MEKKIEEWWARFSQAHKIDTRYVDEKTIVDEYYICNPDEKAADVTAQKKSDLAAIIKAMGRIAARMKAEREVAENEKSA